MWEDISSERDGGSGWVRVTCDALGCKAYEEGRPKLGEDWPPGWAFDLRQSPATSNSVRHYCPQHVARASA